MATTKQNFAVAPAGTLVGAAVGTAAVVIPVDSNVATELNKGDQTHAAQTVLDQFTVDLSAAGNAKNGAFLALGSGAITVDLTATSGAASSAAGDTSFAQVNDLIINNYGAVSVVVGAAAATPFLGPLGGTTPTFTVPVGGKCRWHNPTAAGWSTTGAKNLLLTPSSGSMAIGVAIGGA